MFLFHGCFCVFHVGISVTVSIILVGCSIMTQLWNNCECAWVLIFNECQLIIQKDERRKYINLNPTPPIIRGLIKIHKEDSPIRRIVNWKNAPTYRLTKMLSKKLGIYIPVPYTFNVKNSPFNEGLT